jgi:hypothetical protein
MSVLASTWRVPLALGVLTAAFFLLGLFVVRSAVPTTTTYLARFEFKFPGVEAGNFPNGDQFSLNEIIEPNIVGTIYDRQALDKFGIDRDEFFNALTIRPFVPQEAEITERFQQQLADRRLTLTEKERLETQLRRLLDQGSKGGAEVALTLRNHVDIPREIGRSIVQAIPLVWSEYMIEKKGVLRLPDFSASSEGLSLDAVKKASISIGILQLIEASDQFRDRLSIARGVGGIQTSIDPKTQKSIRDLANDFNDLELFQINPLRASLPTIAQIDGVEQLRAVAQQKLRALKVQEEYNTSMSKALTSTMDQFVQGIASLKGRSDTRREAPGTVPGGTSTIPQLSEGFIDKLVDLSTRGRESEEGLQIYVSRLTDRQLSTAETLARIRSQQDDWRNLIDSLKSNDSAAPNDQTNRLKTPDELLSAVARLNDQWATLNRLEVEFTASRLFHTSRLYNLFYTSPDIIRYNPVVNPSVLLLCLAAACLVFFTMWFGRAGLNYLRSRP